MQIFPERVVEILKNGHLPVKLHSSAPQVTELNSSKAIAGKELSLCRWCAAPLYIHHFSTVVGFSSKKYRGSTGHRNSWYQQRNLQ